MIVKLAPLMVVGAIDSVKVAEIAELLGTPVVGPGAVVTGTVNWTLGRVVSVVAPVVKCHTKGLANARPFARLVAPVIVAV